MIPATRHAPHLEPARRKTHLVLNPVAGAGWVGRRSPEILRALAAHLDGDVELDVTLAPGRAEVAARHAARSGADLIVAIGGDGTVHEVANGLLTSIRGPGCTLGIFDGGTGSGLADSLDLPSSADGLAATIAHGVARHLDVGRMRFHRSGGFASHRRFVNECQVGVGAAVCAKLGRKRKRLGGRLGYGLTSLITGLRHKPADLAISIDDRLPIRGHFLGVMIANGSRTGGGMKIAPEAELDDGHLDLVLIHEMPAHARPRFLASLYAGRHGESPYCTICTAKRVAVYAADETPVAADGEVLGTTPLSVEVEPGALRVAAPRKEAVS